MLWALLFSGQHVFQAFLCCCVVLLLLFYCWTSYLNFPLPIVNHKRSYMRMHIDYKICHFLLLNVAITEARKQKNIGKTGFHGLFPCRGSTVKWFLFHRVSQKIPKIGHFFEPLIATFINDSSNYFFNYKGLQKWPFSQFFWKPCRT